MMIKSISYWAFPGGLAGQMDIEQAMAEAAKAGFEGIELAIGSTGALTHRTPEARCRELVAASRKHGIRIVSVCTGEFWGTSLTDPKTATRKRAFSFLTDALKVTGHLKAGALLVVPGCVHADFIPNCTAVPYDVCYKTALAQIRRAARVAEQARTFLCIENVWNKFLLSPLEFRQFIRECNSRWVGAYFDVANNVPYGVPAHWVSILGRLIRRVHFKEYGKRHNADGSVTWTGFPEGFEVPLGKGDVDYPGVIAALKGIGYKGPVTYELLNFNGDPKAVERCSREMDVVLGRRRGQR
jgi:L-ribulose-5-phosphate 3-epimerase